MINNDLFTKYIEEFNQQIDIIKSVCGVSTAESIEILKAYKLNEIKCELVQISCRLEKQI